MSYEIHGIQVLDDSVVIQFMELPADVRVRGRAVMTRSLRLHASHPDYERDRERLIDLAREVLVNGIEDFESSEPYEIDRPDEDEPGEMGSAHA